jgi:hypothetical protein
VWHLLHSPVAWPLACRSFQACACFVDAQAFCFSTWQLPQPVCPVAGSEYPMNVASRVGWLGSGLSLVQPATMATHASAMVVAHERRMKLVTERTVLIKPP